MGLQSQVEFIVEDEREQIRIGAADHGPEALVSGGAELLLRMLVHWCSCPASPRNLAGERRGSGERAWKENIRSQ